MNNRRSGNGYSNNVRSTVARGGRGGRGGRGMGIKPEVEAVKGPPSDISSTTDIVEQKVEESDHDQSAVANLSLKSAAVTEELPPIPPPPPPTEQVPELLIEITLTCCFCRAFEGSVFFTRSGRASELPVDGSGIYSSKILVPKGKFDGFISYQKRGWSTTVRETVDHSSWTTFQTRVFDCDERTKLIQFISRDCYYHLSHEKCTEEEFFQGHMRLMVYMAKKYLNSSISDFNKIISDTLVPEKRYTVRDCDAEQYWSALKRDYQKNINEDSDLFIKRILLIIRLDRVRSLSFSSVYQQAISQNAADLMINLFGADQEVLDVMSTFISKLAIQDNPSSLQWIIAVLVLKPNSNVGDYLSRYQKDIVETLAPFHNYLSEDALLSILKNLQSVRTYKMIFDDRTKREVSNTNMSQIVKLIISSQRYKKAESESDSEAEFQAISFFVKRDRKLFSDMLNPTIKAPFAIGIIRHLPIDKVAEKALYPALQADIDILCKKCRLDEFKSFIQYRMEAAIKAAVEVATKATVEVATKAAGAIYSILADLFELGFDGFIKDIHSVLPAITGTFAY